MANWNSIHVFGSGKSRVVGGDVNGSVATDTLTSVAPLLAHLAKIQTKGVFKGADNLSVLHIINGQFIELVARPDLKGNKNPEIGNERIAIKSVDAKLVDALATEILKKATQAKKTKKDRKKEE